MPTTQYPKRLIELDLPIKRISAHARREKSIRHGHISTLEGPGCGAEVPLMRSLWLAKKSHRSVALQIIPKPEDKRVDFEIIDNAKAKDAGEGTVKRGSGTCRCCGYTTPVASVQRQMKE